VGTSPRSERILFKSTSHIPNMILYSKQSSRRQRRCSKFKAVSLFSAYRTLCYKGICVHPEIGVLPSGISSQTLHSADLSASSPRHVDRRKRCRLRSIVACLLHTAPAFVRNTLAVTQSDARFVCDSWGLLHLFHSGHIWCQILLTYLLTYAFSFTNRLPFTTYQSSLIQPYLCWKGTLNSN